MENQKDISKQLIDLDFKIYEVETKLFEEPEEADSLVKSFFDNELVQKVDSYDLMIQQFAAKAELYRIQAKKFQQAAQTLDNFIKRFRQTIKETMQSMGVEELKGSYIKWKLVKGRASLVIEDETKIPDAYKIQVVELKPDKEIIRNALEENKEVPGAKLEESTQLRTYTSVL